ncbi:MAG: 16S rRNA (guanine(527)-N(7))-methyltransferase RsmG [Treponema sp.]|jgi:16S rRNA (guanine527-N7)-methyltransferase|nr:16S rRNA (guanine(527)-N(7))-methyltransferase RsmG [Treponema sp.]
MDGLLTRGLKSLCESDSDTARIIGKRFDQVVSLLERYIAEIELFNAAYGLVSVKNREELVVRHILDSLSPLGIIARLFTDDRLLADGRLLTDRRLLADDRLGGAEAGLRIADVGSGAGLPGIPLAICLPGVHFTLIERMGRRAGFLRNTQAVLSLANIEIEEEEMEKVPPARFDAIVFRAFRPLDAPMLKGLFRLLKTGDFLAAYKGRREAIDAEMAATESEPAGRSWKALSCPVPFLKEERHLVVIGKDP